MNIGTFTQRIASVLQDNRNPKVHPRETHGQLNTNRLGLYGTTDRIFFRPSQDKKGKNYYVSILADASGSMRDDDNSAQLCIKTVIDMTRALESIEGVHVQVIAYAALPLEIKGFEEPLNENSILEGYIEMFKLMSEVTVSADHILYTLKKGGRGECASSYTHTAGATYAATSGLLSRQGSRVVLVFTDGRPNIAADIFERVDALPDIKMNGDTRMAQYYARNPEKCLLRALRFASRNDVEVLAVGINEDSVKQHYDKYIVVNDINDLYHKSAALLASAFHKDV